MAKLNLSSPWQVYYRKLEAFFAKDPEVHIVYDDIEQEIKLYVEDANKAAALEKLLPHKQEFGNVTLYITIVPANDVEVASAPVTYDDVINAVDGNGAVYDMHVVDGFMQNKMCYIIFNKEVVQYFTDSIGDWHGLCSTLYQNLAKDLFGDIPGVFFCTDNGMGNGLEVHWP